MLVLKTWRPLGRAMGRVDRAKPLAIVLPAAKSAFGTSFLGVRHSQGPAAAGSVWDVRRDYASRMTSGAPASVFISYSHADKDLARALAGALQDRGVRIWIDEGELRIGDSIIERIATAITEIDFFLVLVSESSRNSNWCRKELALAVSGGLGRQGVKVLPVRVEGASMPHALADVYYLDLNAQNVDDIAGKIVAAIPKHRRGAGSSPGSWVAQSVAGQPNQRDAQEQELKRFLRRLDKDKRFREEVMKGQGPAFNQAPLEWRVDFLRLMVNAMASAIDKKIRVPEADRVKLQMLTAEYERLRDQQRRLEND